MSSLYQDDLRVGNLYEDEAGKTYLLVKVTTKISKMAYADLKGKLTVGVFNNDSIRNHFTLIKKIF